MMPTPFARAASFATCFILLAAAAVRAQADPPPRLTVAAAGGVARQFYADFNFDTAPAWQLSGRGHVARHFAIEGLFEQWAQEEGQELVNQLITGPLGPIGRVGKIEERTRYRMRTIAFNALATGSAGRAYFAGGGGAGVMGYDRRFVQDTSACDAATATLCAHAENTFSSDSFTVQAVAEGGAAIARRILAFGRYDLVVPARDPGFGHGTLTAGIRIVVW